MENRPFTTEDIAAVTSREPAGARAPRRESALADAAAVRRGPLARAFYALCHFLSRILAVVVWDFRFFGIENVPRRKGLVLASNHASFLDPWTSGVALPRPAYYLARENLFRIPLLSALIRSLNALPLPRGGASSRRGIDLSRAVLASGGALVLFPEGTRSRDGRLGTVKRGVGLIAGPEKAPVVPVLIQGTYAALPRQRLWPSIRPLTVLFGRPLRAVGEEGTEGGDPAAAGLKERKELSADLVSRLVASYRSLEARARRVRRAGAAPAGARPHYFC